MFDTLNVAREAAEVHRQVRAYAHKIIKPGLLTLIFFFAIFSLLD